MTIFANTITDVLGTFTFLSLHPGKGCRGTWQASGRMGPAADLGNFIWRRFATPCTYLLMKMEQTECSETSAYKIQTPGNYP